MIYADFEIDADKKQISLTLKGHADAGKAGHDLVCASASILAYTIAQNVIYARARGLLKYEPTTKLKSGDAKISCRARNSEAFAELSQMFCYMQTGFQLLAHNYPDKVVVKLFGEGDSL